MSDDSKKTSETEWIVLGIMMTFFFIAIGVIVTGKKMKWR